MTRPHRLRVFFDTNVILSGFISPGTCQRLLRLARDRVVAGIISPQVVEEAERNLRTTFEYSPPDMAEAMGVIHEVFERVETPVPVLRVCRDPSDDPILAAALEAKADVLVTGDQDLLVIPRSGKLRILSPADLLRELESAR